MQDFPFRLPYVSKFYARSGKLRAAEYQYFVQRVGVRYELLAEDNSRCLYLHILDTYKSSLRIWSEFATLLKFKLAMGYHNKPPLVRRYWLLLLGSLESQILAAQYTERTYLSARHLFFFRSSLSSIY